MKRTHILIVLALAVLFLAGCSGGGGTSASSNPQYYVYNDGGDAGGGDIGGGGGYDAPEGDMYHLPEPATLALFGSGLLGLAGYALARLKRRKK